MGEFEVRNVEHQIQVNAAADEVFRMLAEVANWPQLFPPTVFVDQVEASAEFERIRIWATANGEVKNWTSRRVLDPIGLRIDFRQEVSSFPVAAMGGAWLIEPVSAEQSLVRLLHDYRAIDDDPANLDWIAQAVERNSRTELAALKANVEMVTDPSKELVFSFTDTILTGGTAKDVFDFLNQAQLWQERLPHVARVRLSEDSPGLQILEMDTRTKDGSTHTTKSVRVCFPDSRIVYKQITLPSLMSLHTGCWQITEDPDSGQVSVSSQHTVAINEANLHPVLGPDATLATARDFVRNALGTNSRTTLQHAKEHAEQLSRQH